MILKKRAIALLLFLFPTHWVRPLVYLLGARIEASGSIGFSWIDTSTLMLGAGARIGHLNLIKTRRLIMRTEAKIGTMNWVCGKFSIQLGKCAEIGARNVISRAEVGQEIGTSSLRVGNHSKITASHKLDLLRTITFGSNSILAGNASQLWTHGYVHEPKGAGRFRIDGRVKIGNDVYIGSACILNPGVFIANEVTVGSHCCVSKTLSESGLYVNQPLRHIQRSVDDIKNGLLPVIISHPTEPVYIKK